MHKFKKGFTLAEVLITLLIIGVVASIVVPALINDSNEAEYNIGLKKAQSELSNALKMIQVNNGGSVNAGNSNHSGLRSDFCNVMVCNKTDIVSNIFGPANYKYYKGTNSGWPYSNNGTPAAALNNGYLIEFNSFSDCNSDNINACGTLFVDINGKKLPNMFGKDLYRFWIIHQNENSAYLIFPYGTKDDTYSNLSSSCVSDSHSWGTSYGCTAKRLYDSANMP